jgi:hypothetical protein
MAGNAFNGVVFRSLGVSSREKGRVRQVVKAMGYHFKADTLKIAPEDQGCRLQAAEE